MPTMSDKLLALVLALAGLAALTFGHVVDGAETAALFAAVAGTAGVVGLQVLGAALHAVLQPGQVLQQAAQTTAAVRVIEAPQAKGE